MTKLLGILELIVGALIALPCLALIYGLIWLWDEAMECLKKIGIGIYK